MISESEIGIHVIHEPAILRAFVQSLTHSPLAGGIGRTSVWEPAMNTANFPLMPAADADYILLPIAVSCLEITDWPVYGGLSERGCLLASKVIEDALADAVASLHQFSDRPERLVFLQFGDYADPFEPLSSGIVMKVSAKLNTPRCIVLPYYLEEFGWRLEQIRARPIDLCTQDFSFLGDLGNGSVRRAIPAAAEALKLRNYRGSINSVGYHDRQASDRERYIATLDSSCFILCPRGIGLNSLRFFETLAFGRIPVLLADNARLPLDWIIDWNSFVVRVPETEIDRIADYIETFLAFTSLEEAAARARQAWEEHLTLANTGALIRKSLMNLDCCS